MSEYGDQMPGYSDEEEFVEAEEGCSEEGSSQTEDYPDELDQDEKEEQEQGFNNDDQDIQILLSTQENEKHYHPNTIRITTNILTKYEKAMIIGKRAKQISRNSPIYIDPKVNFVTNLSPIDIAELELAQQRLPFIVRRIFPNGEFEDWKVNELKDWF